MKPVKQIENELQNWISKKRYEHSFSVAKTCEKLAVSHNEDVKKAYLAGLVHDCAKELSPALCEQHNIIMTNKYESLFIDFPSIWHALVVDQIASYLFDIEDKEVLNAAKWHTTGTQKMTKLAKIVFIADYIEPLRTYITDRNELTTLANNSLDKAVLAIVKKTINNLLKSGRTIYSATIDCYNEAVTIDCI